MTGAKDLVRRLRAWTHAVDAQPASDLMDEAAGMIEKLLSRLRLADAALKSDTPVFLRKNMTQDCAGAAKTDTALARNSTPETPSTPDNTQDDAAMSPASTGSVADEILSDCKTCGLRSVMRGGQLVTLVNWSKNLVAPSPCPECMEESKKHFAEMGRRYAEKANKAVLDALDGTK